MKDLLAILIVICIGAVVGWFVSIPAVLDIIAFAGGNIGRTDAAIALAKIIASPIIFYIGVFVVGVLCDWFVIFCDWFDKIGSYKGDLPKMPPMKWEK